MGVLSSYLLSSMNDAMLPHLRGPVEEVFEGVVEHKGLPTRADFRELRNRVDMLDFRVREATRLVHEIPAQAKRAIQAADDVGSAHSG